MIRPSQLNSPCGLAPVLAERYPESSIAAERGTNIHAEIARKMATTDEARAAIDYLAIVQRDAPAAKVLLEQKVQLHDPDASDVLITEGTADVVIVDGEVVTILDWKTGRMENVAFPDDNLQILTYALGAALYHGAARFRAGLAFLDGGEVTVQWSRTYEGADWWAIWERIKSAAARPAEPVVGPHCTGCYQRKHCPSWTLPAHEGPGALEDVRQPAALTPTRALRGLLALQAMREACDVAEEHLRDFVRQGGRIEADGKAYGPSQVAGRESADLKAIKADGLTKYVKRGPAYERWGWRKAS